MDLESEFFSSSFFVHQSLVLRGQPATGYYYCTPEGIINLVIVEVLSYPLNITCSIHIGNPDGAKPHW